MPASKRSVFVCLSLLCLSFVFAAAVQAQDVTSRYTYRIEMMAAHEPPEIESFPQFDYPDSARKNGVEGTLKAVVTLGEDGRVREVLINEGLPHGVTEAVSRGLQQIRFKPASANGKPAAVKLLVEYIVTAVFDERDGNVAKPKITEKPAPAYPESARAEKIKGKVEVRMLFRTDGTAEILNVSSVMPKEFDRAALAAAKNIRFEPAIHKKSKKPVSQEMIVVYDFKP